PLHAPPDQPANFQPLAATAARRSTLPAANVFAHLGVHVILPWPAVDRRTGMRSGPNTADTVAACASVSAQSARPLQAPLQRTKRSVGAGAASSWRTEPESHWVVHDTVHETPGRSLVTEPAPENETVRPTCGTSSRCSHSESWMSGQLCEWA